ncbi:uncharacterized protein LOC125842808 [Solanum stenotomum]|uniref:uncharacterized protein LOC125842808 n=1 Tax=Solanum stenotomum TaxID=172797 RepID=UPI0020D14FBB|nr:uncharacterized protein LOC125842808 [Solanum stenotomum]
MVHLAQSVNVPTSRVEAVIPGMIERAIATALAPTWANLREHRELSDAHDFVLDALTVRLEFQAISEIPPATTTGDVVVADEDAKLDAPETEEEEIGTRDAAVYDDLEVLEGR